MGLHSVLWWILPVLMWLHSCKAAQTSSNLATFAEQPSPAAAAAETTETNSRGFLSAAHRRRRASVDAEVNFETMFDYLPERDAAEEKFDLRRLFAILANREPTSQLNAIDMHAINTDNGIEDDGGVAMADYKRTGEGIPLRKRELNAMERAVIRKEIMRRLEENRSTVEIPIGLRYRRTKGLSSVADIPQRNSFVARHLDVGPRFDYQLQPRQEDSHSKWMTGAKSQFYL